jgi:hypothetical protein
VEDSVEPAITVPAAPVLERPPGIRDAIGRSLDLALAASPRIRRASLYFGLLGLALAGPAVILLLGLARRVGSLEEAIRLAGYGGFGYEEVVGPGMLAMLRLSGFCAVVGLLALEIEAQIVVTAILGGVATGRRIGLRDALRLSRVVFWQILGAAILVGILRVAVDAATSAFLHPTSFASFQSAQIWQLIVETAATAPFAFFTAGIVIGGAGVMESLRRSTRIARARWRLALLVASTGAVGAFIQAFALGAGLDMFARVGTAAGLGLDGPAPVAMVTVLVVLVALVAIGSLVVTIAALIVAPQVLVFLGMTGYSTGLDRAITATGGYRWSPTPRLVTLPMVVLIGLSVLAAAVGLTSS